MDKEKDKGRKIDTSEIAFMDYFDGDMARQIAVYKYVQDNFGKGYYLNMITDEVFVLANPTGEKIQEASLFINFYNHRPFKTSNEEYDVENTYVKTSSNDIFFRSDEEIDFLTAGFSTPDELSYRLHEMILDLPKVADRFNYKMKSLQLGDDQMYEKDLIDVIKKVNENERKKVFNPKRSIVEQVKDFLIGKEDEATNFSGDVIFFTGENEEPIIYSTDKELQD